MYIKDLLDFGFASYQRVSENKSKVGISSVMKEGDGTDMRPGLHIVPIVTINLNKSGCTFEKDLEGNEDGSDVYHLKFS